LVPSTQGDQQHYYGVAGDESFESVGRSAWSSCQAMVAVRNSRWEDWARALFTSVRIAARLSAHYLRRTRPTDPSTCS